MKESLVTGLSTTNRYNIDEKRTIDFMGDEGRVYATPELLRDIENTCRDFLLEHLDEGEDSVGIHVDLSHSAPTPLGMWLEITASVSDLKGRRVTFDITARDPVEEVAKSTHTRFVVDVQKSIERLKKKMGEVSLS